MLKKCAKCKLEKELSEFGHDKRTKDKVDYTCKICVKKYKKQWYEENKEKISNQRKEYYQENKEEIKVATKERYNKNKDKNKQYREKHRDERLAYNKKWREENKGYFREHQRQYRKNCPERHRVQEHNRRARIAGNGGKFTIKEWEELKNKYGNKCLCCDRTEPEIILTPDHIIPLISGGTSFIDNIQPLCGPCNFKKHTKTIDYRY